MNQASTFKTQSIPPTVPVRSSQSARSGRHQPLLVMLLFLQGAAALLASNHAPPRVSYLDGGAAYVAAGDVDWDEVTLNLPLARGDRLVSQQDARIEVEFSQGNFVRIAGETDLVFSELSKDETTLEIHQGDLILRINDSQPLSVQCCLASMTIEKMEMGLYRIRVESDGSAKVIVFKGQAKVQSQHGKKSLASEQQLVIDGYRNEIQALPHEPDDFELWSGRRDALAVNSNSIGYLDGVHHVGIHALDRYGTWSTYGHHGHVWVPRVSVGWAPFRLGRWGYLSFGMTWISEEPWGWLPYHYGNWVYYRPRARWAWVPGGFNNWIPAHVDFYWGSGYVGWTPRGYYGARTPAVHNTIIINKKVFNNWNHRDPANGLSVIRQEHLGRGNLLSSRRITPSRAIVKTFRQGLPRDLKRSGSGDQRTKLSRNNFQSNRHLDQGGSHKRKRVSNSVSTFRNNSQGMGRRSRSGSKSFSPTRQSETSTSRKVDSRHRNSPKENPRVGKEAVQTASSTSSLSRNDSTPNSSRRSKIRRSDPEFSRHPSHNQSRGPVSRPRVRTSQRSKSSTSSSQRTVRSSRQARSPSRSRPTVRPSTRRHSSSQIRSAPRRLSSPQNGSTSRRPPRRRN